MTPREAVNWLINLTADIGKSEHHDLWHYEQALCEIRDMLQSLDGKDTNVTSNGTISRTDAIELVKDVCDAIMSGCKSHYDSEVGDEVYDDIREVDAILKCNKEIRKALRDMPSAEPEHLVKESGGLVKDLVNDTISRKSVIVGLDYIINELNKLIIDNSPNGVYMDIKDQVEEIKRGVLNIPSAQLDIEEKLDDAYAHGYSDAESKYRALMDKDGDAISRQAAIDEAKELYDMGGCYCDRASMIGMLNSLPPAQPLRAIKDCRNCRHGNYNDHWGNYFCYCPDNCNDWDKWEPSAQPERPKGHWIFDFAHNEMTCSECGRTFTGGFDLENADNFCRHCGSDNRGEQDENY